MWIYLFTVFGLVQLIHYFQFHRHFPRSKDFQIEGARKGVSIIIAFKDEVENLRALIPDLLAQEYPVYEVILVNDHSVDGSSEYLSSINDPRIKEVHLTSGSGKKRAIKKGIEHAHHELLLFTDADCLPGSKQWIQSMSSPLQANYEIVVGFGKFKKEKGLLNKLQRYENFMNTFQNFSRANFQKAYMAVGRNLAYHKKIFIKSKVFESYIDLKSGDDDLLVNEMSKKGNTYAMVDPRSFTVSAAKSSWRQYFHQKRRQLEAGKFYKAIDRFQLALLGLSQLFFNLLFISLLVLGYYPSLILSIFVVKTLLQWWFYSKPLKQLGEFELWIWIPLLEFIFLPLISLIGLSQYLWKVDRWK